MSKKREVTKEELEYVSAQEFSPEVEILIKKAFEENKAECKKEKQYE